MPDSPPVPPESVGLEDVLETDRFVRGRVDNAYLVFWWRPPTVEALEQALAPTGMLQAQYPRQLGLCIVSMTAEFPPPDANAHASRLMRDRGPEIAALAICQESKGFGSKVNRLLLGGLLALAGAIEEGPRRVCFVDQPHEAVSWLETALRNARCWRRAPGELEAAGRWLTERCLSRSQA